MEWNPVNFDWNHVRAFLVTAEEGSLSAAARALAITQPTLSRQVSALEQEMGVTLFERVGKGMALTAGGEQLLEHAREMGEAATALSLAASGQSQCLEGRVTVSASEIDALLRLPAIVTQLQLLEPGIQIEIIATNESSDLKRREADIALRSYRPTQGDLIAKKVCEERVWFYGSREYLAQLSAHEPEQFFTALKIIGFDQTEQLLSVVQQAGWPVDKRNIGLVSHSHMVHWQLVKAGAGVSLFPEQIGREESDIEIVRPELGPPVTVPLWLVCHRELRTSPRVRRVFEILADALATDSVD